MEVARHVHNTQNRKWVVFLQDIKKNCCNCFVLYYDEKHADVKMLVSYYFEFEQTKTK